MTHPISEKQDDIVNWAGNSTTVNGKKYIPLHGRHNFDSADYTDSTSEILRKELALSDDFRSHGYNNHREP